MSETERIINQAVENVDIFRWAVQLGVRHTNPLSGIVTKEMKDLEEIVNHFKEESPDDPYVGFMQHVSNLAPIPNGEPKLRQVLNSVRLRRLAKSYRTQAEKTERELRGMMSDGDNHRNDN